jgi:hypothetical protein
MKELRELRERKFNGPVDTAHETYVKACTKAHDDYTEGLAQLVSKWEEEDMAGPEA